MDKIKAKVFQRAGGLNAPAQRNVEWHLTKTKGYCYRGSRYITRANARDLFLRKTKYAIVRNDGSQRFPKQARPMRAHLTETRLRIGCHVLSGTNFHIVKLWALNG